MSIEATDDKVAVFEEAYDLPGTIRGDTRAGLEAVFALIDPVPDEVHRITDAHGVGWQRSALDPAVWIDQLGFERHRTAGWINEHYGPLTWAGRTDETGDR
jgi:uncharacterized protein YPO0396